MINTSTSDLVGIPQATLQQWLLEAQTALKDLVVGGKPIQVAYTQGDGQKMVTYTKADIANLRGYIQELKAQLGITPCGRAPITPYFTSGSGGRHDG